MDEGDQELRTSTLIGLILGYALYAGGIWKGDVLIADLEELETMDAYQRSFTLTIPWNSEKLVKIFHGIIARLHHTDRRLMVLPKEQCAE